MFNVSQCIPLTHIEVYSMYIVTLLIVGRYPLKYTMSLNGTD